MAAVFPGMDTGVYYPIQWLIAVGLVGIAEFVDFASSWTPFQKRDSALIAGGWAAGTIPAVMLILSVVYLGGVWFERSYGLSGVIS